MVASSDRVRIEIAFEGGHALTVYVAVADADALEAALKGEQMEGFTMEAEDGHYTLALAKIVFVKRFARESRVGFGASV